MESNSRRGFIKKTVLAAGVLPFVSSPLSAFATPVAGDQLSVHLFSKVLHFLDWKAAGKKAAQIGFSGLDLTVRPKGHVLPEHVKTDLPIAIKAIQEAGSEVKMISTNIESVNRPLDVDIIRTAGKSGVEYYRPNWYEYSTSEPMQESIERYKQEVKELSLLNKECGIIGSYQNRDGQSVGASFWEVKQILETCDTSFYGSQYDIRHAVVEGGFSWKNGFRLLQPNINAIVLKDFKWGKVDGKWTTINTPVGEGMVDFDSYFKLLKKNNLKPPVSLHVEYALGGAEHGDKEITVAPKVVYEALQKDLETVQTLWKNA